MLAKIKEKKPGYHLNSGAEFVIENYNFSKPFANFFPGIAGKYGIPMWTFYVNRGQAISALGIKDKDHAIMEFFSANKAWQLVSSHGFRTFIKLSSAGKTLFYEPFHNGFTNLEFNITNRMYVSAHQLTLEEENASLGLKVRVEYFNIPNDNYAGLARIVSIKNTSRTAKKLQLLDGLPQIVPFGTSNLFLKKLGRTIEAWMNVENLQRNAPFYRLSVDPTDRPEVIHIKEGNFYLAFSFEGSRAKITKPIVDPECIFGPVTDFSCPRNFLAKKNFPAPAVQNTKSKMPSAFQLLNLTLGPKEEKTFYSLVGYMRSLQALNSCIGRITAYGYLEKKKEENKKVIEGLQDHIYTSSGSREFNLYAQQTYLDNLLRGGYPFTFKNGQVFYLYSRKHGDLERDYNKFQLQPTYFSQGNGNYRDMNQNRRCDTWFNPQIKDENLINFFNLIQTDGFNPLLVKGTAFVIKDDLDLKGLIGDAVKEEDIARLSPLLTRPFTPGEVALFVEENGIRLKTDSDTLLELLVANSLKIQEAEHAEGFWTDHWTYNLDLVDNYLGLYPEKLKEIFFEKRAFTFYDNTEVVKPRSEKYLLKEGAVRQLHSVVPDTAKREVIRKRAKQPHLVRKECGKGDIYYTTLINKLLCLLANKLASLDPFGIGIEMEADKPNWFDALNGLPALLGSSSCETFELKRLVIMLKGAIRETGIEKICVSEEIGDFLLGINRLVEEYLNNADTKERDYQYWDKSHSLKEEYRAKTKLGLSGRESQIDTSLLIAALDNALRKIDSGLARARDNKTKAYYSYFINEVTEYELLKPPLVKAKRFIQKRLPLFLEAEVHALKLSGNSQEAKSLYRATRSSSLYDKKLRMYKVTAPLAGMPEEIGRCRVFTPGWLENESIWLHMEYKYLLETLKNGLYEEFYEDFKNVLIPFQNPSRYGRSILENSSFLVSSAFPDKNLHGNGFVARLSGSTAEFLNIWLIMNAGHRPFFLNDNNELNLSLRPILTKRLFDRSSCYSFKFLSSILVTYHNPARKDTFGKNAAIPKKIVITDLKDKTTQIASQAIPSPYAEMVRSCQVKKIEIYLE